MCEESDGIAGSHDFWSLVLLFKKYKIVFLSRPSPLLKSRFLSRAPSPLEGGQRGKINISVHHLRVVTKERSDPPNLICGSLSKR